jgi:hypothetical protein
VTRAPARVARGWGAATSERTVSRRTSWLPPRPQRACPSRRHGAEEEACATTTSQSRWPVPRVHTASSSRPAGGGLSGARSAVSQRCRGGACVVPCPRRPAVVRHPCRTSTLAWGIGGGARPPQTGRVPEWTPPGSTWPVCSGVRGRPGARRTPSGSAHARSGRCPWGSSHHACTLPALRSSRTTRGGTPPQRVTAWPWSAIHVGKVWSKTHSTYCWRLEAGTLTNAQVWRRAPVPGSRISPASPTSPWASRPGARSTRPVARG